MENRDMFFTAARSVSHLFDFSFRTVILFAFWYVVMLVFIGTYHPALHLLMTGATAVFSSAGLSGGLLS
ncbi:hypothetical protein KY362_07140 [Candidatus Woesearchaeota archaeon]|nr:hypothetical protein [Candidatus Woesearchaeota archaeon]